ncbi:MAG: helix-turn-helix transcriptional regulator [Firmicutes bacterium]|nr:helix-turn-helix transcriptional regulator [Bacillota bacterium]
MPREKYQTLTEQMFYILVCLQVEQCGMDIMEKVALMTDGRVSIGPGTLYHLLENFVQAGMICETKVEGRRRSYLITEQGKKALEEEYQRLQRVILDYEYYGVEQIEAIGESGGKEREKSKLQTGKLSVV